MFVVKPLVLLGLSSIAAAFVGGNPYSGHLLAARDQLLEAQEAFVEARDLHDKYLNTELYIRDLDEFDDDFYLGRRAGASCATHGWSSDNSRARCPTCASERAKQAAEEREKKKAADILVKMSKDNGGKKKR